MSDLYNFENYKQLRRNLRKASTLSERLLWSQLRDRRLNNLKFYRQFGIGSYIVDFYCPLLCLVIELDGGHHAETAQHVKDKARTAYLNRQGIKVMRFWNHEVLENLEGVVEVIKRETTPPSPS